MQRRAATEAVVGQASGHFALSLALLIVAARFAGGCGNGSTVWRAWSEPYRCPLFVIFASPQTMLSSITASLATLLGYGTTGTIGPSECFATVAATIALARCGEEYVRLPSAHGLGMPRRGMKVRYDHVSFD